MTMREDTSRDSWCTPQPIAHLIGPVDIDPCSNDRSHIEAKHKFFGDPGSDGLTDAVAFAGKLGVGDLVTFINPPYSRGNVLQWVRAWRGRAVFLLRFDPSTQWFSELMEDTAALWFYRNRINFEPPPGVKSGSNPFPHALYIPISHRRWFLERPLVENGYTVWR